jgi:predicted 3-demethylubiquinone-9 3-methyltransferase (glyoxalase superfamily)
MFVRENRGKAEAAINRYVSVFDNSRIIELERWGAGEGEPEGTVKRARFSLRGQEFMAMDSHREHPFTFTPAISIFVECETEAELDRVFGLLSRGGMALMPLGNYGFSRKFGWVADEFGVSWQLNLANE